MKVTRKIPSFSVHLVESQNPESATSVAPEEATFVQSSQTPKIARTKSADAESPARPSSGRSRLNRKRGKSAGNWDKPVQSSNDQDKPVQDKPLRGSGNQDRQRSGNQDRPVQGSGNQDKLVQGSGNQDRPHSGNRDKLVQGSGNRDKPMQDLGLEEPLAGEDVHRLAELKLLEGDDATEEMEGV